MFKTGSTIGSAVALLATVQCVSAAPVTFDEAAVCPSGDAANVLFDPADPACKATAAAGSQLVFSGQVSRMNLGDERDPGDVVSFGKLLIDTVYQFKLDFSFEPFDKAIAPATPLTLFSFLNNLPFNIITDSSGTFMTDAGSETLEVLFALDSDKVGVAKYNFSLSPVAVPVPATLALLSLGLGLAALSRRKI
jgi:hypothetical protein